MAGIAGIILRRSTRELEKLHHAFQAMMKKLGTTESQISHTHLDSCFCLGNILPLHSAKNNCFQTNHELKLHCVIEGLVFINPENKKALLDYYKSTEFLTDYELIPYLYALYGEKITEMLTGWFNIFIINFINNKAFLFNDRLGYLPLYYYESDSVFMFASKLDCLLSSGLLNDIEFDATTIAEHLYFHYPISDYTYINNINTLPNAHHFMFIDGAIKKVKYWGVGELFHKTFHSEKESIDLIDNSLNNVLKKILFLGEDKINLSLTGGWDSRVVLAYLIKNHKDRLTLFSFGAPGSDDIEIPRHIASKERLNYTAYLLDQSYLDHEFLSAAIRTIILSNGTRSYKRSHYIYAAEQISSNSNILLAGIFGDEMLKISSFSGATVFSQSSIDLISNDFNIDQTLKSYLKSQIPGLIKADQSRIIESFASRLEKLKYDVKEFETQSQKYYFIRLENNLRKYFGYESNSYNDYLLSFSPFIDFDFIKTFATTSYMGLHYPFNSDALSLKIKTTNLYTELVRRNCKALIYYTSSRGYSMNDTTSLMGKVKILLTKKIKKGKLSPDAFNTKPTDKLFYDFLIQYQKPARPELLSLMLYKQNRFASEVNSLCFWMRYIRNNAIFINEV